MTKEQEMVLAFHRKMGLGVGDTSAPALANTDLRLSLIAEELQELRDAIAAGDLVGAIDALGDLQYVVLGSAVEWGVDLEPAFAEIQRSNMTKEPGLKRADGKLLKGPSYSPPDIAGVLRRQK